MARKPIEINSCRAVIHTQAHRGDLVRVTGGNLGHRTLGPLRVAGFSHRRRRIFLEADDTKRGRHTLYVNGEPYQSGGIVVRPYIVELLTGKELESAERFFE